MRYVLLLLLASCAPHHARLATPVVARAPVAPAPMINVTVKAFGTAMYGVPRCDQVRDTGRYVSCFP